MVDRQMRPAFFNIMFHVGFIKNFPSHFVDASPAAAGSCLMKPIIAYHMIKGKVLTVNGWIRAVNVSRRPGSSGELLPKQRFYINAFEVIIILLLRF